MNAFKFFALMGFFFVRLATVSTAQSLFVEPEPDEDDPAADDSAIITTILTSTLHHVASSEPTPQVPVSVSRSTSNTLCASLIPSFQVATTSCDTMSTLMSSWSFVTLAPTRMPTSEVMVIQTSTPVSAQLNHESYSNLASDHRSSHEHSWDSGASYCEHRQASQFQQPGSNAYRYDPRTEHRYCYTYSERVGSYNGER